MITSTFFGFQIFDVVVLETSQGREQFRQAVHFGKDRSDTHRQTFHDEFGSDRVHGFLLPKSGVRAACLNSLSLIFVLTATM